MSKSIIAHIINKYTPTLEQVTFFSRTKEKALPLLNPQNYQQQDTKLIWRDSPKEAAEDSDVVITMVGYPRDVREVVLAEHGVLQSMKPNSILVDLTTSEPSLAKEIYEKAIEKKVHAFDIPVSGGDVGARNGQLTLFVGGNNDALPAITPLLNCFAKSINYFGEAGKGQHAKMSNQIFIATCMIGLVEGMIYAYKAGLNVEQVIQACSQGAAKSFSMDAYAPRILRGDLNPGFFVEHFIKDMEIVLAECRKMNIVLPGLTQAKLLYDMLRIEGKEKLGTQALILVLEKMNNVKLVK